MLIYFVISFAERERQRDRETERQTETERQREIWKVSTRTDGRRVKEVACLPSKYRKERITGLKEMCTATGSQSAE